MISNPSILLMADENSSLARDLKSNSALNILPRFRTASRDALNSQNSPNFFDLLFNRYGLN